MNHNCINLPKEASHWSGKVIKDEKGANVAWQGTYQIQGLKYQVSGGKTLPRQVKNVPVNKIKETMLKNLLERPDILPDDIIIRSMKRRGCDTSAVLARAKNSPLPDGRLFTDKERLDFASAYDWFDSTQLEILSDML